MEKTIVTTAISQVATGKGNKGVQYDVTFVLDVDEKTIEGLLVEQLRIKLNRLLTLEFALDAQSRKDSPDMVEAQQKCLQDYLAVPMTVKVSEMLAKLGSTGVRKSSIDRAVAKVKEDVKAGRCTKEEGLKRLEAFLD